VRSYGLTCYAFVCFFVDGGGGVSWRNVYSCIIAQVALNKFTALLGCVNVGGREISACHLSCVAHDKWHAEILLRYTIAILSRHAVMLIKTIT
jgi:hypothetical protein